MELLGTMFLCFYGGMAINTAGWTYTDPNTQVKSRTYPGNYPASADGLFGIALTHGMILGIYIYAGASNGCGCHFNPAVSLGMILLRKCGFVEGLFSMVAQLAGSFAGAALTGMLSMKGNFNTAPPAFADKMPPIDDKLNGVEIYLRSTSWWQGAIIETLNTFFLMFTILYFTSGKQGCPSNGFGAAIGLTLTVLIVGAGPLTGCAANPFRSIGPDILGGHIGLDLLVYETFPFIGSLLACLVWWNLVREEPPEEDTKVELADVDGEFKVEAQIN